MNYEYICTVYSIVTIADACLHNVIENNHEKGIHTMISKKIQYLKIVVL